MKEIPKELKIVSFKDFCIRSFNIYYYFWEYYAPFFDIVIYRDYLLEKVIFSNNEDKQEMLAGKCWEYLMGDISQNELFGLMSIVRRENV